jgi:hypothetical protein
MKLSERHKTASEAASETYYRTFAESAKVHNVNPLDAPINDEFNRTADRIEAREEEWGRVLTKLLAYEHFSPEEINAMSPAILERLHKIETIIMHVEISLASLLDAEAGRKGGDFFDCPQDDEERETDGEAYRDESRD